MAQKRVALPSAAPGFTLIELLIVIAMIAVLVAIAIPGLLAAQRSANERSAGATLKTFAFAQTDFRTNDRDNNQRRDYWTADVFGLYGMFPANNDSTLPADDPSSAMSIKLVDSSLGGADGKEQTALYGNANVVNTIGAFSPKAGYLFRHFAAMEDSGGITTLLNDTDGPAHFGATHDPSRFGIVAFPETLGTGRSLFMVNQDLVIFKYGLPETYVSGYTAGASSNSTISSTGQATYLDDAAAYPAAPTAIGCSKLD